MIDSNELTASVKCDTGTHRKIGLPERPVLPLDNLIAHDCFQTEAVREQTRFFMEIRSITLFCEPQFDIVDAGRFFEAARDSFHLPVQTTRLAMPPFPDWWDDQAQEGPVAFADHWQQTGAQYISLGPVKLRHDERWLDTIPTILSATDTLFATVEIADQEGQIDPRRCYRMAGVVQQVSTIIDNGFGNLYLAALANCPPGSPFFPVAYHQGGPARFAVAVDSADLALEAICGGRSLAEARQKLIAAIEAAAGEIAQDAQRLAEKMRIPFGGIDFSLAPYPTDDKSLAAAMEAFGLPHLGAPGSLFTAAIVAEAINQANFPRCGFSGLMLTVLEDSVLADRAGSGLVGINELLGYASVCGVGLDTVPLAGDISQAALTGILLDVAALSVRLDKPLTARLMPIPGLKAGDLAQFNFPFFADGRVMKVENQGVGEKLSSAERLTLRPYRSRRQ